jgi:hypothetical protein
MEWISANFQIKGDKRQSAPVGTGTSSTAAKIKHELEAVKATAQEAFDSHRRFWPYTLLEGTYGTYFGWKAVRHSKKNAKKAARLFGIKVKSAAHPLDVIIQIVSPAGADTRRWVDALLFAYNKRVARKDLVKFLKANGGIAGCAHRQRQRD